MSVVTLGGMSGGGARTLGPLIAEALNADYVDRIFLTQLSQELNATVQALHEVEERAPTFGDRALKVLQRILERSAVAGSGGDPYFGPGLGALVTQEYEDIPRPTITRGHEIEDDNYISVIRASLEERARSGDLVFVGRGGHLILKDMTNVLRVGVVAHLEDRIQTIMEREGLSEAEAAARISARDAARRHYFSKFFQVDDPDRADYYHITVNTSEVGTDFAVDLITNGIKALNLGDGKLNK